jgi:hypothetical protein
LPVPPECVHGDSVRLIALGRNGLALLPVARARRKKIRAKLLKSPISRSEEQAITGRYQIGREFGKHGTLPAV